MKVHKVTDKPKTEAEGLRPALVMVKELEDQLIGESVEGTQQNQSV